MNDQNSADEMRWQLHMKCGARPHISRRPETGYHIRLLCDVE